MGQKPINEGDPITSGPLLRFIPNWDEVAWEYDMDRPSPRAWRKRPGEDYMSIYREADDEHGTSLDVLKLLKPDFAIFRVTAETLIAMGNVTIKYKPLKNEAEGLAHCGVFGVNRARAEKLARGLVPIERAQNVGPAGRPPMTEDGGERPDFWQSRE